MRHYEYLDINNQRCSVFSCCAVDILAADKLFIASVGSKPDKTPGIVTTSKACVNHNLLG